MRTRRHLPAWAAVWAGWTALALFFATSTSLTYLSTGRPANWSLTIARALAEWWLWAPLTPFVAWLARRYPVHGARARRHLAVLAGAGVAVALGKTVADRAVFAWISGFWVYLLASTFALQLSIYAVLVAAAHGLQYYRSSREREQLEARLSETRLQLLNMQLQPHFLFNTLNTIAELVHDEPDTADTMITGLSDLLRRALELGAAQEITLDEELDLLSRYLDIQRARFGDRLRVSFDIAAQARGLRVPVLLLQPVVENAIRHGLGMHLAAGRILISAAVADSRLRIEVVDDGRGNGEPHEAREGIGLRNTRDRLAALYGPAAVLSLGRVPGGGVRVALDLPARPSAAQ